MFECDLIKKEYRHSSAKSPNFMEAGMVEAPTCSHDLNDSKVNDFRELYVHLLYTHYFQT